MPLPLEIATTPHAHDAQVGEIIDLFANPASAAQFQTH